MPLIPQLRRLRQECLEFQASLGNPMRPWPQNEARQSKAKQSEQNRKKRENPKLFIYL
jgi:hypothetical protein